ncbi:MAG TPA: zinc ribbon domain-containing protein [Candidatus Lokiarchaeia archaeon]|nr:zinc ribbon domain-containing protein [Candidatus Lokiarchaeia archaeon]
MYNPKTKLKRVLLPPYQTLGKRLRSLAILVLISAIVSVLDTILFALGVPPFVQIMILNVPVELDLLSLIDSLLSILIFIFQVLIIIHAKSAAKAYARPALNRFASFFIFCLVLFIASNGINYVPLILDLMSLFTGTVYTAQSLLAMILEFSMASTIVYICSISLQLAAWLSMVKFFRGLDDPGIQSRGTNWTRLVTIALVGRLGVNVAIGIPLTIMENSVYFITFSIAIIVTFEILDSVCIFALTILIIIGFLKLSTVFQLLGTITPLKLMPSSGEPAIPRMASFSSAPLENPLPRTEQDSDTTCSHCGFRFHAEPGMQFCPSCGARFESTTPI